MIHVKGRREAILINRMQHGELVVRDGRQRFTQGGVGLQRPTSCLLRRQPAIPLHMYQVALMQSLMRSEERAVRLLIFAVRPMEHPQQPGVVQPHM